MLFELVTMLNIATAAEIHAISWRESHKSFCSKEFVDAHTTERQMKYIENEIKNGKQFYILMDAGAKGIVSIKDNLIENLYVLPSEQRKGYGTKLLKYAEEKCQGPYGQYGWRARNVLGSKQFYLGLVVASCSSIWRTY